MRCNVTSARHVRRLHDDVEGKAGDAGFHDDVNKGHGGGEGDRRDVTRHEQAVVAGERGGWLSERRGVLCGACCHVIVWEERDWGKYGVRCSRALTP